MDQLLKNYIFRMLNGTPKLFEIISAIILDIHHHITDYIPDGEK
jgi:hypothetical protein